MKKILGLIFMTLVITGCSTSGEKTTTVCKSKNMDEEVTIKASGDEATTFTSKITNDFTAQGYEITDEEAKIAIESQLEATFKDLKGVTYKIDSAKDGVVISTIEVDYTKADLDALTKANIVDIEDADYISLEKTVESLEENNYSCQQK